MSNPDESLKYRLRLIWEYKDVLRNHIPPVTKCCIKYAQRKQLLAAHRLKGKEKIDVAFFLPFSGAWKSDYLFQAMRDNPRYNPYIVIYPYSFYKGFAKDEVDEMFNRTKKFVADKGFEYRIPYDEKKHRWLDPKKEYQPDIVFFTVPYKDYPKRYFVYHYSDTLTCYVPYGFSSLNLLHINYDLIFHNLVGMHFVETEIHKQTAAENSRNHGSNVYITGYPGTEVFLHKDYIPTDVWKPQSVNKKRLIWAPHHTMQGNYTSSTFLCYSEEMLRLAKKYSNNVQFVFKPHPLLKFKLQLMWGEDRTNEYYKQWEELENGQLEQSSYIDLFLTSDAMIHDCGSFTTEYMFTKKPVMYLTQPNINMEHQFSPFGVHSYHRHYHGASVADIEHFIEDVVIGGNDPMADERKQFFDQYLAPKDGLLPSEKIIKLIEERIDN